MPASAAITDFTTQCARSTIASRSAGVSTDGVAADKGATSAAPCGNFGAASGRLGARDAGGTGDTTGGSCAATRVAVILISAKGSRKRTAVTR